MAVGFLHRRNPVAHHIAEGSDLEEAPQAEGHGCGIERRSIVKTHIGAQGNRDGATAITQNRGRGRQAGFQGAIPLQAIERIPQGADQLRGAEGAGLGWIQGADSAR